MDPRQRLQRFKRSAKALPCEQRRAALASEEFARLVDRATFSPRAAAACEVHCDAHCVTHCEAHCLAHPD
ncbi:hypothetical protein OV203_18855 [Nannocystis sp. ILAH1]|uniref:hypothetical protein n=1 Tax=unclassified Nannocystis TaxID=2627009 RepID=UPI00227011DE|nr:MULTISPECIES: hypothetical protein [unclassified Nannocystis]MCY0989205.1 hypothetical protein [Nannocystis sp. ILAH1]MCY1065102.1 hypothetical protein [Nannocystis sp. RBIL2]